jgi:hypothetical protein
MNSEFKKQAPIAQDVTLARDGTVAKLICAWVLPSIRAILMVSTRRSNAGLPRLLPQEDRANFSRSIAVEIKVCIYGGGV